MVSAHPYPPADQDFSHFHGYYKGGGPTKLPGMNRYDSNLMERMPVGNVGVDDPSKKIRKPYTITKSRENWTEQEHEKFIEALHL